MQELIASLRDGRAEVRADAARALGAMGPAAVDAAGWLAVVARDQDEGVREAAVEALVAMDVTALPFVVLTIARALDDASEVVRSAAKRGVLGIGEDGMDSLVGALTLDPSQAQRRLVPVLRQRPDAVALFTRALRHAHVTVRINAALALFDLAQAGRAGAEDSLVLAKRDDVAEVRAAADNALFTLQQGGRPPPAFEPDPIPIPGFEERDLPPEEIAAARPAIHEPRMLLALRDGREWVRRNACVALSVLGSDAQQSSGWLALAMKDPDDGVREAAIRALAAVTPVPLPMTVRALVHALADPAARVTAAAEEVLGAMVDAPIDALLAGLDCDPGTARRATLPLILRRDDARGVLGRGLSDPVVAVRVNAARGLYELAKAGDKEAGQLLDRSKDDPAAEVRDATKAAQRALAAGPRKPRYYEATPVPVEGFETRPLSADDLAGLAGRVTADRLVRSLSDGRDVVRRNACLALGALGGEARESLGWLAMMLKDPADEVREAAIRGILGIGGEPSPLLVRALVHALHDGDRAVEEAAQDAMEVVARGEPQALIEGLDTDPGTGRRAVLVHVLQRPDATAVLGRGLQHRLATVRVNAAQGLWERAEAGDDDAIAFLRTAAEDPVGEVRDAAAGLLTLAGGDGGGEAALDPEPIPIAGFEDGPLSAEALAKERGAIDLDRMVRALRDGRDHVRENAARALAALGIEGSEALGWLALSTKDPVPAVRIAAVQGIHGIGGEPLPLTVQALVHALADRDTAVVDAAEAALHALSDGMPDALIAGLDTSPGVARRVVLPLIRKRDDGTAVLARALVHRQHAVRVNAAVGLQEAAAEGDDHAAALLNAAAADPQSDVREAASEALAALTRGAPPPMYLELAPIEVEGFDERPVDAQTLAAAALDGRLECGRLMRALQDGRAVVRRNAAAALGALGPRAGDAIGWLAQAVRDPDPAVREEAVRALGAIVQDPIPLAVTAVVRALTDAEQAVQGAAQEALASVAAGGDEALVAGLDTGLGTARRAVFPLIRKQPDPALVFGKALARSKAEIRVNAAAGLWELDQDGDPGAAIWLAQAEQDPLDEVRQAARGRLSRGGDRPPAAAEPDPVPVDGFDVRALSDAALRQAAEAALLGTPRMVRALQDGRDVVRENAARALGVLRERGAVESLILASKDPAAAVRAAAREALGRVPDGAEGLIVALAGTPDVALPLLAGLPDGVAALAAAAAHPDRRIALAGVRGLVELGGAGGLAALEALPPHGDPDVDRAVGRARESLRTGAPFVVVLDLPPVPVAGFEERALTREELDAACVAGVLEARRLVYALADARPVVRRNAAAGLGALGEAAIGAVGWLAASLHDDDPAVREAAALAFGTIPAPPVPVAVRLLVAALSDGVPAVADAALATLRGLEGAPGEVLAEGLDCDPSTAKTLVLPLISRRADAAMVLGRTLQSQRARVRMNAAAGLFELDQDGDALAPVFLGVAREDPHPLVRAAARGALEEGLRAKAAAVREAEPYPLPGFEEGELAWSALAAAAPRDEALPASRMRAALADGRDAVRANGARALALVGAPSDVPALLLATRDAAAAVRQAAGEALDRLSGAGAALVEAIRDHGALALAPIRRRSDAKALLQGARLHDDVRVARPAARALAEIAAEEAGTPPPPLLARDERPLPLPGFADGPLTAEALAAGRGALHVGELAPLLSDGRAAVRRNAAAALAALGAGAADAAGWLAVALRDGDVAVRQAAVLALEACGAASLPLVVRQLVAALDDPDGDVGAAAARALLGVEGDGTALLIEALDCDPRRAAGGPLQVLWARPDGAQLLVRALADPRLPVRVNGAFGLWRLGIDQAAAGGGPVLAALDAARSDSAAAVREAALGGLAWLLGRPRAEEALEADPVPWPGFEDRLLSDAELKGHGIPAERLVRALSDGRRGVRVNAARALEALGSSAADLVEAPLLRALRDSEARVREAARDALAALGRPAPEAPQPEGPPPARARPQPVREAGAVGVAGFDERPLTADEAAGADLSLAACVGLLSDGRATVRRNAAAVLGAQGGRAVRAAGELAGRVRDASPEVRAAAAEALVAVGGADAFAGALVEALRTDPAADVRATCATALAGGAPEGLLHALSGDPTFVQGALMPLVLGRKDAGTLLARAASHPNVAVRVAAALGCYRRGDGPALEALTGDEVTEVREAARAGLRGLRRREGSPPYEALSPGLCGRWIAPGSQAPPASSGAGEGRAARAAERPPAPVRPVADGRPEVRAAAAAGASADDLALLLKDSEPAVRLAAARAGAPVSALGRAVDDPDPDVAAAARWAVAAAPAAEVVAGLHAGGEGLRALVAARDDALDLLTDALRAPWPPTREAAIATARHLPRLPAMAIRPALLAAGGQAAEAVLWELAQRFRPERTVREEAPLPEEAWADEELDDGALARAGKAAGVERLLEALSDGRDVVRTNSVRALGLLGKAALKGGAGVPGRVLLALKDGAPSVRAAAAQAVARLSLPVEDAVPALLVALSAASGRASGAAQVAEAVIAAVQALGPPAVDACLDALGRPDLDPERSVERIARARPGDYVGPLAEVLATSASPVARRNAADVLAALGPFARPAEAALAAHLDDPDFGVRLASVRALGRLGDVDDRNVFRLMDVIRSSADVSMVLAAKEAFRYLGLGWRIPG